MDSDPAMIRDQQIPANTLQHLLLDKLSTTVAVLIHVGILAHGNILRIWAELSVDLNLMNWNVRGMKGPTPVKDLSQEACPIYSDHHFPELRAFSIYPTIYTSQTMYQALSGAQHCCLM